MWEHPLTDRHIQTLKDLGYIQIPPVAKTLACGDIGEECAHLSHHSLLFTFHSCFYSNSVCCYLPGIGAMAEVGDIVTAVLASLEKHAGPQLNPEKQL